MSGALLERGRSEVKEGGVNTTKQVLQFNTLFTALAWILLHDGAQMELWHGFSWKTSHSGLRGEVFVEDTDVLTLHTSRSTEHVRGEVVIINQA